MPRQSRITTRYRIHRDRDLQPARNKSTSVTSSPDLVSQGQVQNALPNPTSGTLTPQVMRALQQQHGNRFVQRLVIQARGKPVRRVQRAGRQHAKQVGDTLAEDPGISSVVGTFGDYLGTDPNKGVSLVGDKGTGDAWSGLGSTEGAQTTGGIISTGTGAFGIGINIYSMGKNIDTWSKAEKELQTQKTAYEGDQQNPGDKALFATVELLNRKKAAAQKGTAEASAGLLSSIAGFINGVSALAGTAAGAVVAGVAFSVGSILGALVGTIQAIRAFFSAGKRAKSQAVVGNVLAAYTSIAASLEQSIAAKKQESDDINQRQVDIQNVLQEIQQLVTAFKNKGITPQEFQKKGSQLRIRRNQLQQAAANDTTRLAQLGTEIQTAAQQFDEVDKMRVALAMSKRKMGLKGKLAAGGLNLGAALGGALLFAATLGAATGPAGWVIAGIAVVGTLAFTIGMKVKQSIRKSNVERMKAELALVEEFITNGSIDGQVVQGAPATPGAREKVVWQRDMFTGKGGVTQKGWFNRLISKKKSGTMDMAARRAELEAYLAKYDKAEAADTIFEGFKKALAPGADGDQMVDNPKYDATKPKPGVPQKVTLRSTIEDLLTHFFGAQAGDMKESILSPVQAKSDKAKALLAQKMKLGGD